MSNLYVRIILILLLLPHSIVIGGMNPFKRQLELCPTRTAYIKKKEEEGKEKKQDQDEEEKEENKANKPDPFCNPEVLRRNYVVYEDQGRDVRVMMNLLPYLSFDQGDHLLVMPISHKEGPDDFSPEEFANQVRAVHGLSRQLHPDAVSQEHYVNWGKPAGQSVDHWHSQLKNYREQPHSLPEQHMRQNHPQILNMVDAFRGVKTRLNTPTSSQASPQPSQHDIQQCTCCSVGGAKARDKDNFVVKRFKYNYVCLSHYPNRPAELSIVPLRHVSTISDLSEAEFLEHMVIARALMPVAKAYADEHICTCGGINILTKSVGNKAPDKQKRKHHVHTVVIPRISDPPSAGTIVGNSSYLPFDPTHLLVYLAGHDEELRSKVVGAVGTKRQNN